MRICKKIEIPVFDIAEPLTSDVQLLCVLPPDSFHLVNEKYKHILTQSETKHFYPSEFNEDFYHKTKRWQTIPNIPFIDVDLLLQNVENMK